MRSQLLNGFVYHVFGLGILSRLYLLSLDDDGCIENKPSVLCLSRLHFERDIAELRLKAEDYNWLKIPEDRLGRVQTPWVPHRMREQTYYDGKPDCFVLSERMAHIVIESVSKKYPVKAVMAANIDYWQSEGFRRACKTRAIPFLTLCREAQTLPLTYEKLITRYKSIDYKYKGRGIAVFNKRTRDALIQSGICNAEDVEITGPPRLDPWLENLEEENTDIHERKYITLLSYFSPMYYAQDNFIEVAGILADIAKKIRSGDFIFRIKCKGKSDYRNIYKSLALKSINTRGLSFSYEADLLPLYKKSRVIIGYNSLAIIEALFSRAIVIVPQWGEAKGDQEYQNIKISDPLAQKLYYFPQSAMEFRNLIEKALKNELPERKISLEEKIEYMNYYFSLVNGEQASVRVQSFVRKYIN